jgi:hypothetical protein
LTNLEALVKRLLDQRVEFVIIGGYAVMAHGVPLLTQDVDICCRFSAGNLLRLQAAVADLHPVHRMTPQKLPLNLTQESCAGLKNLYLRTDFGVIDCLGEVKGVGGFDAVVQESVTLQLDMGDCRVLSLDALIRAKEALNRPRDLQAIIELRAIKDRSAQD